MKCCRSNRITGLRAQAKPIVNLNFALARKSLRPFQDHAKSVGCLDPEQSAPRTNGMKNIMRSKTTKALFHYWTALRGDRQLPRRDEIRPADIHALLPEIFILQRQVDGAVRFRLAGTHVCDLFGQELRDQHFATLWLGEGRQEIADVAGQVMTHCAPMLLSSSGATGAGDRLDVEVLLVPLASPDGKGDRVLGALSPLSRPIWLHMTRLTHLVTEGLQILNADAHSALEASAAAADVAVARVDDRSRVPYLRILEGGRRC